MSDHYWDLSDQVNLNVSTPCLGLFRVVDWKLNKFLRLMGIPVIRHSAVLLGNMQVLLGPWLSYVQNVRSRILQDKSKFINLTWEWRWFVCLWCIDQSGSVWAEWWILGFLDESRSGSTGFWWLRCLWADFCVPDNGRPRRGGHSGWSEARTYYWPVRLLHLYWFERISNPPEPNSPDSSWGRKRPALDCRFCGRCGSYLY